MKRLLAVAFLLFVSRAAPGETLVARPSNTRFHLPTVSFDVGIRGHGGWSTAVAWSITDDAPRFDGYVAVHEPYEGWIATRVRPGQPRPEPQISWIRGEDPLQVRWLDPEMRLLSQAAVPTQNSSRPELRALVVSNDPELARFAADGVVGLTPAEFDRFAPFLDAERLVAIDVNAWTALARTTRERLATNSNITLFGGTPPPDALEDWLFNDLIPATWDGRRWVPRHDAIVTTTNDGVPVIVGDAILITGEARDPRQIAAAAGARLHRLGLVPSDRIYFGYGYSWTPVAFQLRGLRLLALLLVPLLALLVLRCRRRFAALLALVVLGASLILAYAWPARRIARVEVVTMRADEARVVSRTFETKISHEREFAVHGEPQYLEALSIGSSTSTRYASANGVTFVNDSVGPLAIARRERNVTQRNFPIAAGRLEDHVLRVPAMQIGRPDLIEASWECGDHVHLGRGGVRDGDAWVFEPSRESNDYPPRIELELIRSGISRSPLLHQPTYWLTAIAEDPVFRITGISGPIGSGEVARYWFDNPRLDAGTAVVGAIPENGWPADAELDVGVQVLTEESPPPVVTLSGSHGEVRVTPSARSQSSFWDAGWESGCSPAPTLYASLPADEVKKLLGPNERLRVRVSPPDGPCERVVVRVKPRKKGPS